MVRFHDPRGEVRTEMEPYELSRDIRPHAGAGVTVALIANGFPDSELFVSKVGEALGERLGAVRTRLWNKGNPAAVVSGETLAEIASECQVAIAAYGH